MAFEKQKAELSPAQKAERSISKQFRRKLWSPFVSAIKEYQLIQPNDKIAVCISGGKDSMLMAKLIEEIKKHGDCNFEVHYIVMDPGYSVENRNKIIENAKIMNIPIEMFDSDIFEIVTNMDDNPCYLCARMRRGCLYKKAQQLGCNKIALGHHFDDVIETVLMGMLYAGQIQTMMPKLHSNNYPNMEIIRPMYYIREHDINFWKKYNDLDFIRCACRFTEQASCDNGLSKRKEIKDLIKELHKVNPYVENNIYRSMYNVNLNMVIEYSKDGKKYNFLDSYDEDDSDE